MATIQQMPYSYGGAGYSPPAMPGVLPEAASIYSGMPAPYAPNFSRVAGFTPMQQQAWATQLNADRGQLGAGRAIQGKVNDLYGGVTGAGGLIGQGANTFDQGIFQQMGGSANPLEYTPSMDFFNNPHVQGMVEGATGDMTRNFQRNVLPGISSQALGSGNYGSTRQGIAEGIAMSDLNKQIGDVSANIRGNAYGQGLSAYGSDRSTTLGSQLQNRSQAINAAQQAAAQGAQNWGTALNAMPMLNQLYMQPFQTQGQMAANQMAMGQQQQNLNQARLNEAGNDYMQNINAPWQNLNNYNSILSGMPIGQFGNQYSTQAADNPVFQNPSLYQPQVAGTSAPQKSATSAGIGGFMSGMGGMGGMMGGGAA